MAKKIKVLVVDDTTLVLKIITRILTSDPAIHVVGDAADGIIALRKIKKLKPDVITLDLEMPRMDGLTTLKHIVRDYGIPVILVSSHTTEGAEVTFRGLNMGAVDFIPKPETK